MEEKDSEAENIFEITPEMVQEHHLDKKSKRKLNVLLWKNIRINTHEERIVQSRSFWSAALALHKDNKAETVACLKGGWSELESRVQKMQIGIVDYL